MKGRIFNIKDKDREQIKWSIVEKELIALIDKNVMCTSKNISYLKSSFATSNTHNFA